jgi:hypothetical protein
MVNFCEANCSAAVHSEKVRYVESCLGREPKELQAFQLAQAAQGTTLSKETIGRAMSLEGGSTVQCLQVSVSWLPTVY